MGKKSKNIITTKDKPEFSNYKKGAIVGGLIGGVAGLIAGKRILLYTAIGAIAGGYISYSIYKDDFNTISFKKFTKDNDKAEESAENINNNKTNDNGF